MIGKSLDGSIEYFLSKVPDLFFIMVISEFMFLLASADISK